MDFVALNGVVIHASDGMADRLLAAGWRRADATEQPKPIDLSGMTVAQLRALCGELGIDAPKRATKAQLVQLLG
jgi:hypothetical protein